jgi:hypothetical protein
MLTERIEGVCDVKMSNLYFQRPAFVRDPSQITPLEVGGTNVGRHERILIERSTMWPEDYCNMICEQYNITGGNNKKRGIDEYFILPFMISGSSRIEANDTPIVISPINSDRCFLDMLLRYIDTTMRTNIAQA